MRSSIGKAVVATCGVVAATFVLAAPGPSGPGVARAATISRASTLLEGKYLTTGRATQPSASPRTQATDPKPAPSSEPNGAIEQWEKQVGPTYVAHEQTLDSINTWINDQPALNDSGYIGAIEDAQSFSIKLLWHGSDALLTSAQSYAKSKGADVVVEQRPYSQSQLDAATSTLWSSRAVLSAAGFDLTEVVQVSGEAPLPVVHGNLSASVTATTILGTIEKLTGVRYTLVNDGNTTVPTSGRGDDTSPFFGGALMVSSKPPTSNSSICSTGFTVNYAGKQHTTTARHCQPDSNAGGEGWFSYTTNARMGPVTYTANTGALNVLVGNGGSSVYVDNYASSRNNFVVNVVTPGINSTVCSEGGNSGAHCNLTIHATGVSTPDSSSPSGYVSTVRADSGAGGIANMAGDSGGPVVKAYGSDGTRVSAVGMIQAGDRDSRLSDSYCAGQSARSPQVCYSSVEFTYMSTVQNHNPITVAN